MFQALSGISIGNGNPAGTAFGAGIYAAQASIGFSAQPTKITLNVVSESGQYQAVTPNVSTALYNININGKVFSGMRLYAYEKTRSPGSSLMSLDFIDSSILLDKIFIGLLNRHGNKYKVTNYTQATFTVRCVTCTDGLITGQQGVVSRYVDSIPVNGGTYFEQGADGGGYLILGKENFTDSNCEIPKVDYNFSEFCDALTLYFTNIGLKHELSHFDLNPLYRQEYAGTLREVLNNWASDFSFEFYFDGTTLKAIDLRRPIDIGFAQRFADTSSYVTNASYGESLENSYNQSVVARFLKPSEAVEYDNNYSFKHEAVPIGISSILQQGRCAGRGGDVLLISLALSHVQDTALRDAYIANYAVENNDVTPLAALGFITVPTSTPTLPYRIVDDDATSIILNHLKQWQNDFSNVTNNANANDFFKASNYVVYFGYFREDLRQHIESWDTEAANNFLGKYYMFTQPLYTSQFSCPRSADLHIYYNFNSKWDSIPSSSTYGGNAVPFASLLRDPIANTLYPNYRFTNVFSIEDNAWGIEPEEYNKIKGTCNYEYLKPSIIPFNEFPVLQASLVSLLNQLPVNTLPSDWSQFITQISAPQVTQGAEPAFLIVPRLSKFANTVKPVISDVNYSRTINQEVYNRVVTQNNNPNQSQACLTYCDENIVSEICNCGASFTPIPYFQNLLAPYIVITHPNNSISVIVFPVDSKYYGFFTNSRIFKTTYPPVKTIYGTPPVTPSNAMATRVVDYDITPDIEAVVDNNDAVNQYIYSSTINPATNQPYAIMNAADYYKALANLNNLTVPIQKSVKFSVARTDLQNLGISLSPANGLTAMTVNISDGSSQTELTYSTRPPSVPKSEAVYAKVKYRLYKANK